LHPWRHGGGVGRYDLKNRLRVDEPEKKGGTNMQKRKEDR